MGCKNIYKFIAEAIKYGQKLIEEACKPLSAAAEHPIHVEVLWDILYNDADFKASKDYVDTVKRIGTYFTYYPSLIVLSWIPRMYGNWQQALFMGRCRVQNQVYCLYLCSRLEFVVSKSSTLKNAFKPINKLSIRLNPSNNTRQKIGNSHTLNPSCFIAAVDKDTLTLTVDMNSKLNYLCGAGRIVQNLLAQSEFLAEEERLIRNIGKFFIQFGHLLKSHSRSNGRR
jgi:hypothetical protein